MSTVRALPGGWIHNPSSLPRGPTGRAICRCGCGVEVPPGRRTFASKACVHGWKIKTDPGYLRRQVKQRDQGVCASCSLDTVALRRAFDAAAGRHHDFTRLSAVLPLWPEEVEAARAFRHSFWRSEAARYPVEARALQLGFQPSRRSWWEADHIVPVVEGGGVTPHMTADEVLANVRTLCSACHKRATADLARRRSQGRTTREVA